MPMTADKAVLGPTARTFAILCGAVLWAILFGVAGALTQRAWIGAVCGAVIGAIIGYVFAMNVIGRVVVWVSVMGLLGAVVGPGCDADACTSAVGGAVIGSLLGWFGWTGALMLGFGMLGLGLGGEIGGGIGAVVGLLLGAVSAWFAVYFDRKTAIKDEGDIRSVPPHGKPPEDSASM